MEQNTCEILRIVTFVILYLYGLNVLCLKETPISRLMALNLTHTGFLDFNGSVGFNRLLNVCKRLKAEVNK